MAQGSRSSSGRSSYSSSRGGGGRAAPNRGGSGGGNPVAIVVAVVALAVVIGLVVLITKKPKTKTPVAEAPTAAATPTPTPAKPKEPELGPKPVLPPAMIALAQGMVAKFQEASDKGKALHRQAMEAKEAKDTEGWQRLMEEARVVMKNGRDPWNDLEAEVDEWLTKHPSKGWTTDAVMDAYFKAESRKVKELLDEPLSSMVKTGHSR